MNYIKKSIAVLLVFVVSFSSFAFLANADLKISSIDKEDTYVSYKWDGKIGADGDYHYSSGTITRRTMSGTNWLPIYCLQPNEAANDGKPEGIPLEKMPFWTKLDNIVKKGITWASMYGYKSGNALTINGTTYSGKDAYVATQILIWEWITAWRTDVNSNWSDNAWSNLKNDTIRNCYKDILNLCRIHANNFTFDTTSATIKDVGESNAITVNVSGTCYPSDYEIKNEDVWYSTLKKNDKVTGFKFFVKKVSDKPTQTITFQKKLPKISVEGAAIGIGNLGQQMLYGTLTDPVSTPTITINLPTSQKFKITKVVNSTETENKTYHFEVQKWYDSGWQTIKSDYEVTVSPRSDESGSWLQGQGEEVSVSDGLNHSLYRIAEIKTPEDVKFSEFKLSNNKSLIYNDNHYEFHINNGETLNITANNVVISQKIQISKIVNTAEIADKDGNKTFQFKLEKQVPKTVDPSGWITVSNDATKEYVEVVTKTKEDKSGKWLEGSLDKPISVTKNTDNVTYRLTEIVPENADFRVRNEDDAKWVAKDENGEPLSYQVWKGNSFEFNVSAGHTAKIFAYNMAVKPIYIEKQFSDNAKIILTDSQKFNYEVYVNNIIDKKITAEYDKDGKLLRAYQTDDETKTFDCSSGKVFVGKYDTTKIEIKEILTNEQNNNGWIAPNDVELTSKFDEQVATFINDCILGKLKFEKFDENGNPLIGAKFELRDKDGNVIDTFVSDGSAKEWSKLPFGKYTIVETQAPEGYELNGEAKEFTISKDNKDVYVSMTDKPHTYLMTGGVGSAIFYVLGIGISLTAIAVIFYLTNKKKGNGDLDV